MTPSNRELFQEWVKGEGRKLYATFDESERKGVRFGMFPAAKMEGAYARLLAQFAQDEGRIANPIEQADCSRLLAVGVLEAADAGPDKVVV